MVEVRMASSPLCLLHPPKVFATMPKAPILLSYTTNNYTMLLPQQFSMLQFQKNPLILKNCYQISTRFSPKSMTKTLRNGLFINRALVIIQALFFLTLD